MSVKVVAFHKTGEQKTELERDVGYLIDVFRELHEVEKITGRAGLSARVRVSLCMGQKSAVCVNWFLKSIVMIKPQRTA